MRALAQILIYLGAFMALAGVAGGFVLDLRSLWHSFNWVGVLLGVVLAPVTLVLEPWRAIFSSQHHWQALAVTLIGITAGTTLYGVGHLLALRDKGRP